MIEFSCHAWAYNDKPLSEAFGTIARLGFRYVDLGSGPHLNAVDASTDPSNAAATIQAELDLFNLKVADLTLLLPRISLIDENLRTKDIDTFRQLVRFGKALGVPGVTLSPGLAHPAEDTSAYKRTVESLKEMVAIGKKANLTVSIEPHMDSMAETPDAALKLVKDVPDLKLTVDWAQLVCANAFHADIVKLLPHARHVQVRQAARAQLQTPFERGRIDLPNLMADLRKHDYDGTICIEHTRGPGPHGLLAVNPIVESVRLRDALRDLRDGVTA